MKRIYYLLLIGWMCLSIGQSFGQKKDTAWTGAVHGIVWDAAHNIVLRAATVAIYLEKDSVLIGYQLTNNYGEFDYKGLPCDVPLKLIASYVGHNTLVKRFVIPSANKELDIGHLDMGLIT